MGANEKISHFYQRYKADLEAAKMAAAKGNTAGAYRLYRNAALALCEMANLETGETRTQRIYHAESILKIAEDLKNEQQPSTPEKKSDSSPKGNASAAGEDKENPWVSEGIPSITFDDVVGMEDVKKLIREYVIDKLKYPELYNKYGIRGGTGLLLFGLPGTGKTTIARAIAHEINAPIFVVQVSDVLSKWVGESETRIRQLFDKARSYSTAIIFFDDFDALGKERKDDSSHAHSNNLIVEMITQMDGFAQNENNIILLAATNKPWMIDSALIRPKRFEHHIYVPLPNHEARIMLIRKSLDNISLDDSLDLNQVSELLKGYNGADIKSVVNSVKITALQREKSNIENGTPSATCITFNDFKEAIAKQKSSVKPNDIAQLRAYAASRGITLPEEL